MLIVLGLRLAAQSHAGAKLSFFKKGVGPKPETTGRVHDF